jgi:hypothetical protein
MVFRRLERLFPVVIALKPLFTSTLAEAIFDSLFDEIIAVGSATAS